MKRLLMFLVLMFTVAMSTMAESIWFKTKSFAIASVDEEGVYHWGDWEESSMKIQYNLDTDVITVYSSTKQVYNIYDEANDGEFVEDYKGGETLTVYVVDQDDDKGEVRIRVDEDGDWQIYVDFSNVAWVYDVDVID